QLYDHFSRIGKALASPARIEILDLLSQGEKTVEQLAAQARLGVKNASAHLRALRQARLVELRKDSPWVWYRLADDGVARIVRELQTLARRRLAEVEQIRQLHFEDSSSQSIDPAALLDQVEAGAVTLLDVRPPDEYQAGHIPGAISMPPDELPQRLGEIPRHRPVIAYCRGPFCVYAVEAVATLRRHGYEAWRMESGIPDWRLAGHPIVSQASHQPSLGE
ncbi:MAG TPA: metalloregulator ArsR/SmtB family transcription factor, partial [Thermoanaerobaculia bacterium]|nr:metalloregulator ArsR/SmtB family transcription factor [Thermoanaerobaculia bacterium]